jgi:hypothetical protein
MEITSYLVNFFCNARPGACYGSSYRKVTLTYILFELLLGILHTSALVSGSCNPFFGTITSISLINFLTNH